jgi:hypothetical protein
LWAHQNNITKGKKKKKKTNRELAPNPKAPKLTPTVLELALSGSTAN